MAKQIMTGCTAATHIAYALSDVATIYPITPVASMGETAQKWAMAGRTNYMGVPLRVEELESELGAAGATHGALAAGSLATTFTNSQGLMLMLPNMFKMAGNMVPAVFHVGARSLAKHALSIFGDHSDVMATRSSGFAILASASVQEAMDLALVAHLAAVKGSLPVCHFFDGWRTSNELATIDVIDYEKIWPLIDHDAIARFRAHALNPDHPLLRGSAQNPDVYFQNIEASNPAYDAFPAIVQDTMNRVAAVTGRQYHLFDYVGPDDAETVLISMASSCEVIEQTLEQLNASGYKVGQIKVRLYRPFSSKDLVDAIPAGVHTVAVLDRTKEAGADGEPLLKDVATALMLNGRGNVRIIGGRYGLSSKNFSPAMVKAVVDEALKPSPRRNFTVGITDDVTHLSLDVDPTFSLPAEGMHQAVFYGMGSDGTVGATKQIATIIGNSTDLYSQAFFNYSAKKSGGYTTSELRISSRPIRDEYTIAEADYVGCNKDTYVDRFRLVDRLRNGGIFVLNCSWTDDEMSIHLPAELRRAIAGKNVRFYAIDAQTIAARHGLGTRINMIMAAVFFKLAKVMDYTTAIDKLKEQLTAAYMHEGQTEIKANLEALANVDGALREVVIPASWSLESDAATPQSVYTPQTDNKLLDTKQFFRQISDPCNRLEGDKLPVSAFTADGAMPMGTTAFERRCIAINVPEWAADKCVQCTECSFVCPHAAIRPFLLSDNELKNAPETLTTRSGDATEATSAYRYRIQVYTEDCVGCGSCATICPGHALTMVAAQSQIPTQKPLLDYCEHHVSDKQPDLPRFTVNGSQYHQPLLQFSGACAGCGETPYVKLLTQLFGERMIIANATGCSSIWGANYPSNAYCTRNLDGRGPAWGNSLFEDNAEYAYGMAVSCRQRRNAIAKAMHQALADKALSSELADAFKKWLQVREQPEGSYAAGKTIISLIGCLPASSITEPLAIIRDNADMLGKKSVWAIGGDGWAYDIGFAGLDHVLASGENVNMLVMDTECYSNTGGQTSKATPLGCVTKYSPDGKRTFKKDLGRMMMTYGTVYVASISMGANYQQTVDALREAEAYPGPSIVICYCPCINHGIRKGMSTAMIEEREAVATGYWPLYRYNPALAAQKLSPYIADSISDEHGVQVNGLPDNGSPSDAEQTDMDAANEGPWMRVSSEAHTLTVDYPLPSSTSANNAASATSANPNPAPFALDALNAFLDGENRYADIQMAAPQAAPMLREALSQRTNLVHMLLEGLTNLL